MINVLAPTLAACVIEMPMRVDEVFERIGADAGEGFLYRGLRRSEARVNEHLAITAGQNQDVASRAFEDTDAPSKRTHHHLASRGFAQHRFDNCVFWSGLDEPAGDEERSRQAR